MKSYETFAEAIKGVLSDVMHNGDTLKVRGYETKEIINYGFTLNNPLSNMFYNTEHESKLKYIAGELLWYFSGRNDLEFISEYSNFWKNIASDDGTCNSAYGYLLFKNSPQYKWAYDSLAKDKYSRQAIMHFNLPIHQYEGNKDFVCTMYANYHIRPDKEGIDRLHMTIFMRSNDVIFGLINDVVFFTLLHQQMYKHLKENIYMDLELGSYTHVANSMHIYDRHYEKAEKMLDHEFEPIEMPKIQKDLVSSEGIPSPDIIDTANKTKFLVSDPLYKFLSDYAFGSSNK